MDYDFMNNNVALLSGEIIEEPHYSHQVYGEGFYDSVLSVPRLSGQNDYIPFTISERLLDDSDLKIGNEVALSGQLRSYNKFIDGKSKLLITMFVREIVNEESIKNPNSIDIIGYVCKDPIYRMTPFKREICDVLLAVNRAYNKSDYLPCISLGRNARYMKDIPIGTKIVLNGRIQSREYQKTQENGLPTTRTAYEVSINRIETMSEEIKEI